MDNIKSDTQRLSEDYKVLKEDSNKFSSKIDDHVKKLSSFTTSFDKRRENMSANNRVVKNIETSISELEPSIEIKLHKITAGNAKTIY